ncbi:Hypothetical predicted protein, partial [Pelobates cultripes]
HYPPPRTLPLRSTTRPQRRLVLSLPCQTSTTPGAIAPPDLKAATQVPCLTPKGPQMIPLVEEGPTAATPDMDVPLAL